MAGEIGLTVGVLLLPAPPWMSQHRQMINRPLIGMLEHEVNTEGDKFSHTVSGGFSWLLCQAKQL